MTSDISSLLRNSKQFAAPFDEEAKFCATATQIHTHSPTCVRYSLGKKSRQRDLCCIHGLDTAICLSFFFPCDQLGNCSLYLLLKVLS